MAGFSFFYLLVAFFSIDMRIRYLVPIFAPLSILCIYGLHDLSLKLSQVNAQGLLKAAPFVILAALLIPNGFYLARQFSRIEPLDVLSGRVGRKEYIQRHRPEFALFDWANGQLGKDASILALFLGNRLYYSDIPVTESIGLFQKVLQRADTQAELAAGLHKAGYSHLMIRQDLFQRWVDDNWGANPEQLSVLAAFLESEVKPIFQRSGYFLLSLHDGS